VSRLVNWGHWIVGAVFATWGALDFASIIFRLAGRLAPHGDTLAVDTFVQAFAVMIAFICAWGIWTWRRWGQLVALFLCSIGVLAYAIGVYVTWGTEFGRLLIVAEIASLAISIWLLLPPVRAAYWRREQIA